ncbi:Rieske 2Fe-2S domain-containing protein [Ramlibacter sp. G-1-2-2]|uniref:Rieske 2Fe-2S domain-containing protein n=1 Tax=Ramlibacter agri TaxID=2728837 RepID=A0A848GZA6_9BURK|nr:aromatic ring-hydroxylating dioxygenase subunit alpha [Ramlibacter agri]NML44036.1 Rieske 2Fe-2S domain-containing protein [Ramlibacter agri]
MEANTQNLAHQAPFPSDRWWVAGFGWELKDQPLARTLLDVPLVLFRTPDGQVAALEDRCCHKELPLSLGAIEPRGLRCGYHGLLFDCQGTCVEIPGQEAIPAKARVRSYELRERDQVLWLWHGSTPDSRPDSEPPAYPFHTDPAFRFGGDMVHYDAPYQLVHDNLLDLSHLGYVHVHTIGGNPGLHMNAQMKVTQDGEVVKVVRHMPGSEAPPTYAQAWPFRGRIDRWQEIEFHLSHLRIWTGAVDEGDAPLDDPQRGGFHMRGFHGVTPETHASCHYFWTISTNPKSNVEEVTRIVVDQTARTFLEDKEIVESQWRNQQRFGFRPQMDIHVDAGPNRARRVIRQLVG